MDTIPENLKPFTITFVLYQRGDLIGKLLALITLVPIFISVSYAALLVFNRDTRLLLLLFGQIINEIINYSLKRIIKEPRPTELLGDGTFGMPSSHSQFVCFWATYCLLYINNRIPEKFIFLGRILHLALIAIPILVVYSRFTKLT
jgi:dolichyldiphosphatase